MKKDIMQYSDKEKKYIFDEFLALQNARQEKFSDETLRQWVNDFKESGYSAEHVCRMIRTIRLKGQNYKIKFADFIAICDEIWDLPNIIPVKILPPIKPIPVSERETVAYSSKMCSRVREELGLSYFLFIWARNKRTPPVKKGEDSFYPGDSEEYLEYLKSNPNEIEKIKQDFANEFPAKKSEFISISDSVKTILTETGQLT